MFFLHVNQVGVGGNSMFFLLQSMECFQKEFMIFVGGIPLLLD